MNYLCYVVNPLAADVKDKYAVFPSFSTKDTEQLLTAIGRIEHHIYNMSRLDAVDVAYDEFYSYYKSLDGKDETLIPELERKLRSYILEFRIYLAHWEKYIAHHPRSAEYQKLFKQLTNDAYANNDEYAIIKCQVLLYKKSYIKMYNYSDA